MKNTRYELTTRPRVGYIQLVIYNFIYMYSDYECFEGICVKYVLGESQQPNKPK